MEKVTELKTEPVVGKYYLVPCVEISRGVFPIIGEPHTDIELGIEAKHFHHDLRFMPNKLLEESFISTMTDEERSMFTITNAPQKVFFKKMKCRRVMPVFMLVKRKEYQNLHKNYVGKSIKCGRCPHRNMPLESLPQDEDGNVICNGHGLKINMREKKVVQRF